MRENIAPYRKHRHDTYTDKVATAAKKTDGRMQLLKKDRIFEKTYGNGYFCTTGSKPVLKKSETESSDVPLTKPSCVGRQDRILNK